MARDIWIGITPPPSDRWVWMNTPDALIKSNDVSFLAIEWDCGDGIANGLEILQVAVVAAVLPERGVCIFESDPARREQMIEYMKYIIPKVEYPERFKLYESSDGGKTWVEVPV